MNNNDVLKSIRYTFNFDDTEMIKLFSLANVEVTRAQISEWLKKDDDEAYKTIVDSFMSAFLNGFILLKRGSKDEERPVNEKRLNNNIILRKIKIALQLKDEDIMELLLLADFQISKHEISAFFRKPDQNQFRVCKDQILRKFMFGLKLKIRP